MHKQKLLKSLVVVSAIATLSLQAGCVIGRRTFDLPIAAREAPAATKGQVFIDVITDDREFENRPPDPSIPSIDGDVTRMSAEQKDQMIDRQRNGFGKAMGDIALAQGDSVTQRVRLLVQQGLARSGYGISAIPGGLDRVTVSIKQFWAWMTPGFIALTFEAKISCTFLSPIRQELTRSS